MVLSLAVAVSAGHFAIISTMAQNQQILDTLMAIPTAEENKQHKLVQYTWTETIAIKGNVKDSRPYQLQMAKGQKPKTFLSDRKAQSHGREGRMKERIIERRRRTMKSTPSPSVDSQSIPDTRSRGPDPGQAL